ncbi:hypothetical protein CSB07_00915 [Candidatus Gracilibacteria bacterium]|nr:MAG: hypothetical protein CSB07_00915 [Candidatus Gracilibacteria bacterium]PIE85778.1 MAG: hypothetical protein CSA08_00295 [Candidatus Gracilibacteria bacterium]
MLKKIGLMLLIFFVLYLLLVFKTPSTADFIGNKNFNDFIRSFKSTLEESSTNIPTKSEIDETLTKTYSGAVKLKDNISSGIKKTKDTIDTVRSTLSGAESKYNEAKEKVNEVKTFIDDSSKKIEDVKNTLNDLEKVADGIKSVVNTGAIN